MIVDCTKLNTLWVMSKASAKYMNGVISYNEFKTILILINDI